MYSLKERNSIENLIIDLAKQDKRITDCAIVGSASIGKVDKWSDIDLTFGLESKEDIPQMLKDWNKIMSTEFDAHVLFDLSYQASIYRVYLFPNALQIDLSFTPQKSFGAITDKFKLVFGKNNKRTQKQPPDLAAVFGYSVLYALKSRSSIEREKYWQALHYLHEFRKNLMTLKCMVLELNPFDGRAFDELPKSFLSDMSNAIVKEIKPLQLNNSLELLIHVLIKESQSLKAISYKFEHELKLIANSKSGDKNV